MLWSYQEWLAAIESERESQRKSGGVIAQITRCEPSGSDSVSFELEVTCLEGSTQELFENPELFSASDDHQEPNWHAHVLEVAEIPKKRARDRSQRLQIWIKLIEEYDLEIGDEIEINPPDFLDALANKLKGGLIKQPSLAQRDLWSIHQDLKRRAERASLSPSSSEPPSYHQALTLRPPQLAAVRSSELPLSFVWGPPGTGKTFTLGHVIAQAIERGEKVLVLSSANAAVEHCLLSADQAMIALKGAQPETGVLLRTQVPSLDEVRKRPHLTAWSNLEFKYRQTLKDFKEQRLAIRERQRSCTGEAQKKCLKELKVLNDKVASAYKAYREERQRLIENAGGVFSTFIQYTWSGDVAKPNYDLVVIEEASMLPVLAVMLLFEKLPQARFVIAGDPYQLSPVSLSPNASAEWAKESAFHFFGINSIAQAPDSAQLTERDRPVVNFLDAQSRMPQQLGEAVSKTFYENRLRSTRPLSDNSSVFSGVSSSLVCLDDQTSQWLADQEGVRQPPPMNYKNLNYPQARSALAIARVALAQGLSCRVLTPYKHQEIVLTALFKAERLKGVMCTTVHKAQGSEADVVIYSMTDPGSWFLTQHHDSQHLNVVATSRARQQLIILGDYSKAKRNPFIQHFYQIAERPERPQLIHSDPSDGAST